MGIKIDVALDIEVRDEVIVERVSGRRVCSCGASVCILNTNQAELKAFVINAASPLQSARMMSRPQFLTALQTTTRLPNLWKDFYRAKGVLVEVDGEKSVEETTAAVLKVLGV